jgi:hypothetical protein
MSDDPVEHAVNAMPPYMQRRMAKLSLAGARFVLDPQDGSIFAWKVLSPSGAVLERATHLAEAINKTWREWMLALSPRDANTEAALENYWQPD